MERNNLTLSQILEHFYLEDSILRWKDDVVRGSWRKSGDPVGGISNNGYLRVGLKLNGESKRKMYMVHRLIYQIYHNIEVLDSSFDIDHIDLDPINNSKDNLRIATRSENNCNNHKRKDNTSGYSNISIEEMLTTRTFVVNVQKSGVNHSGRFKSLEDAILFRDSLRVQLHGKFSKTT